MQHHIASDGVSIAYDDQGRGRPLLLLHGLMAHSGFFATQGELAANFRVVTIDLRGHGASPAGGQAPTIERLAADVGEIVNSLGLDDVIGVGWSLGASVLWHVLASPSAERFAGAVVIDMTPRVLNDHDWDLGLSRELCEARGNAINEDFRTFATNAGQAIFAQPVCDSQREMADWAGAEFARNDPVSIESLWRSLVEQDLRPVLGRIKQPTLIVHGAQSHLYGSDTADHLVAALPNARSVQFDRSGHAPHMEQPALFNRLITDFAASLPRIRATTETISQA